MSAPARVQQLIITTHSGGVDVAFNRTAQVTLQRLPVQPVCPFLSYKGDSVSDGQHKTTQQLNLGPSAAWAIFHLTYFMSLFVLLCIDHDSNLTL